MRGAGRRDAGKRDGHTVSDRYIAAPLDRAARLRSGLTLAGLFALLVLILIVQRIVPTAFLFAAPVILVPMLAYAATPIGYALDEHTLYIERKALRTLRIPLASLTDIRPFPPARLQGAMRVYGTGGLFGWAGRYRVRELGTVSMHATSLDRLILVQRRRRKPLLISPTDPDAFLRGLRRQYETIVVPPQRKRL